jgi:predicted MPP superfamily phosphohydrolase
MRKLIVACIIALTAVHWGGAAQDVQLPGAPASLKFAVIGDNGNGEVVQYEVGQQMAGARARFPFELVIMLGDNLLGRQQPEDFVVKFEKPYAQILQAGVPFYAALGNHDQQTNRFYKGFNMGGERYYSYDRKNVRFFVLDSNLMDSKQMAWFESVLNQPQDGWKICYFHHPIYSDGGRHGSDVELRVMLEPLLIKYGVDVVFSSHDHVYERLQPQKGISYFVEGSGGQLRKGDIKRSAMTAASFDQDQTFMLVEIDGNSMVFQAISRTGRIVDSGVVRRRPTT